MSRRRWSIPRSIRGVCEHLDTSSALMGTPNAALLLSLSLRNLAILRGALQGVRGSALQTEQRFDNM